MLALAIGWSVMIAAGVLHAELHLGRPLGFWPCVGLSLPVALLVGWEASPSERKDFGAIFVPAALALGWAVMIAAGVLNSEIEGAVPAIGYWPAAGLALPLAALLAASLEQKEKPDFVGELITVSFALGWSAMIAVGVAHGELGVARTLGFWATAGLALPIAAVIASVKLRDRRSSPATAT